MTRSPVVDPLLVACPYCNAPAGEVCVTPMRTMDRSGRPHAVRLQAVKRAQRDGLIPDAVQPSLDLGAR